jgi:hypothetical protein
MTMHPGNKTKATDTMRNDTLDGKDVNRRGFFKLGGLVALSAAAAACVNPQPSDQVAQTGTMVPPPPTSVPPFPGNPQSDATLVLTSLSLERLAVETYQLILDRGWLGDSNAALARRLQEQHRRHGDAMAAEADRLGQDSSAVTTNEAVREALVDGQVSGIEAVGDDERRAENLALKLALSVEDSAAQLYTRAGGTMTTAALRQMMMGYGAATARQYTVVATVSGDVPVPFAFGKTAPAAVPMDNYIQADEATVPTTGTTPATTAS